MTGFASSAQATPQGALTVEIKSVNNRFLELALRLPEELRAIEPALREQVGARVGRGKVDCRLSLARDAGPPAARVNPEALAQLTALARAVQAAQPSARELSVADILRWPGVVDTATAAAEDLREPALAAVAATLESFQQSRVREGAALRAALLERCERIGGIVGQLRVQVPAMLALHERKLQERMSQALAKALAGAAIGRDEINDRIRQELTLYGLRADVDEELERLLTHVEEVRRVLREGGAVGRRLDFLMQELNREANTVASKASAVEMTSAAVELKLLIEQMREQIQNLE